MLIFLNFIMAKVGHHNGPNFVLRHFRAALDAELTNNAELFNNSSLIYIYTVATLVISLLLLFQVRHF